MKELLDMIGKTGVVPHGDLIFDVTITNVKRSYGKDRYEVTPVAGTGKTWVEIINTK